MIINFTKMHCLGNDFVIINAMIQRIKLSSQQVKRIADRHIGVGCDQIILLEPPIQPNSDFYYKIYNSNGEIAEQCVNGARCAAKLAFDNALVNKSNITAECLSGNISFVIEKDDFVTAKLEVLQAKINTFRLELNIPNLSINNCQIYYLSIGNPHAIVMFDNEDAQQNNTPDLYVYSVFAEKIANLYLFPKGVNIGFASIVDHKINLKVFERGCGETLSCGSNAVAAYLVAKHLRLVDDLALIRFKLGGLKIKSISNNTVSISGSVNSVFKGEMII
jgi:diaminopimelate epimerase